MVAEESHFQAAILALRDTFLHLLDECQPRRWRAVTPGIGVPSIGSVRWDESPALGAHVLQRRTP